MIHATGADAARTLGGAEETSDGLLDRGHRDGVAWVTGPLAAGGVERVAGLADRQQPTLAACLRAIPATRRRTRERAGPDRYAGFVNASNEAIPWAAIVLARVHVARASRDGADPGRQQARKRHTRAVPKAEDAESTGARGPFRTPPGDRQPEARARRARVFRDSPTLAAADHLRADLTARCARDDTQAGAQRAIRVWCTRVRERGLAACESVLGTRDRWMEESTHDCQGRQTSGCVEGFHNRVKVLKRRGDGIFHVGSLVQRLTRDWQGYQRFGQT